MPRTISNSCLRIPGQLMSFWMKQNGKLTLFLYFRKNILLWMSHCPLPLREKELGSYLKMRFFAYIVFVYKEKGKSRINVLSFLTYLFVTKRTFAALMNVRVKSPLLSGFAPDSCSSFNGSCGEMTGWEER